jgi:hypothetical protein
MTPSRADRTAQRSCGSEGDAPGLSAHANLEDHRFAVLREEPNRRHRALIVAGHLKDVEEERARFADRSGHFQAPWADRRLLASLALVVVLGGRL